MKLKVVSLFFICNVLSLFVHGCFPTPQPQTVICPPNPCSLVSSRRVIISSTVDEDCEYTAIATCTATPTSEITVQGLQFNGAGPFYGLQKSLICDIATGRYFYTDSGGISQPANSIICVCGTRNCVWNINNCNIQVPGVGGPVIEADDDCIYQFESYCTGAQTTMQFERPIGTIVEARPWPPGIQPVTCPAGKPAGGFYYIDMFGVQQTVNRCSCV